MFPTCTRVTIRFTRRTFGTSVIKPLQFLKYAEDCGKEFVQIVSASGRGGDGRGNSQQEKNPPGKCDNFGVTYEDEEQPETVRDCRKVKKTFKNIMFSRITLVLRIILKNIVKEIKLDNS